MRKPNWIVFLWIIVAFLFAGAGKGAAAEVEESFADEGAFLVSSQDLYLDHDDLMVVIQNHSHHVQALQKSGNRWKVKIVSSGYCPQGHPLCGGCHLCHMHACIYYIRPCKLWD